MSTAFYKFTEPVSSVSVKKEKNGEYFEVRVFLNGQNSGFLRVKENELSDFLMLFRGEKIADRVGIGEGKTKIQCYDISQLHNQALMNEYGDIGYFEGDVFKVCR